MRLLIACLLLFAQTLSVVHATDHHSHEHSSFCDLADSIAKHGTGLASAEPCILFLPIGEMPLRQSSVQSIPQRLVQTNGIRGPPSA